MKEKHGIELLIFIEIKQQQNTQKHHKISKMKNINAVWHIKKKIAKWCVILQAIEIKILQLFFTEILANNNLFITLIKFFCFKQFFNYINTFVNLIFPDFSVTIKKDFCWNVVVQCFVIQNILITTKFKIHLTYNTWIFFNNYTIWRMQAIFFNSKYHKQNFLIDLKRLHNNYWNEMQTRVMFQVANEYKITKKLKYVIMDNALLNNILMHIMEFILKKWNIK